MREALIAMVIIAGSAMPIQAAINSQLRGGLLGSPVLASLVSFAMGTLALLLVYFGALRGGLPSMAELGKTQWWVWLGGPLGAFFVLTSILAAPRIGAASMIVLFVAGQIRMALVLDHFGLLGMPLREVNATRLLGAALVLVGALLVTRG